MKHDIKSDIKSGAEPVRKQPESRKKEYELTEDEQAVVEAIRAGAHKADTIVSKTGISVNNIMRLLLKLELDGIVTNTGSGMYDTVG